MFVVGRQFCLIPIPKGGLAEFYNLQVFRFGAAAGNIRVSCCACLLRPNALASYTREQPPG